MFLGFKNINRKEGFDLEGAKTILRDLARFQGTAIALKLIHPKLFEDKVKVFCRDFHFRDPGPLVDTFKQSLKNNVACASLADKIGKWPCQIPEPTEPFATIAHGDLWVNNIMQKFENGKIVANVFVDFQVYSYRSCASDVFLFLWTSCQTDVIEHHLDELLQYHYDNLIQSLQQYNCDITKFTFKKFLEEISIESVYEFGHALFFVFIVKHESLISEENLKKKVTEEEYIANLPEKVKDHLYLMIQECDRRGWLH